MKIWRTIKAIARLIRYAEEIESVLPKGRSVSRETIVGPGEVGEEGALRIERTPDPDFCDPRELTTDDENNIVFKSVDLWEEGRNE